MILTEKIVDINTGEESFIEREATPEEIAAFEELETLKANLAKEIEAKKQAKFALLEKLGITEDEAKLLLS